MESEKEKKKGKGWKTSPQSIIYSIVDLSRPFGSSLWTLFKKRSIQSLDSLRPGEVRQERRRSMGKSFFSSPLRSVILFVPF